MTKQVALSDKAYARLRQERMHGESFSQAVERLIDSQPKDPMRFLTRLAALPRPTAHNRTARQRAERDATRESA